MQPTPRCTNPLWHRRLLLSTAAAVMLSGCAQRRPPAIVSELPNASWSGRLALQVEDASQPPLSGGFELEGNPNRGVLTLLNPLGNVVARIEWAPGTARLQSGDQRRESASLAELLEQLTGSALPIAALFAWLRGEAISSPGWEADLSHLDHGRLSATRYDPLPQAQLRIVLDR